MLLHLILAFGSANIIGTFINKMRIVKFRMPAAKNYDVMVVCRDATLREATLSALENIGRFPPERLCSAKSGLEAISAIENIVTKNGSIGVLVSDFKLPDLPHGIDTLIKYASLLSMPVIVASILEPELVVDDFVKKGAFAYVETIGDGNSFSKLLAPLSRLGYWH